MKNKMFCLGLLMVFMQAVFAQEVYLKQEGTTVWTSFENPTGAKGASGMENKGAKGHAFDRIPAGDSVVLVDMQGPGIINRIWMTVGKDRSKEMLQALKIKMYWDNAATPAVYAPLAEFFCNGGATMTVFENCYFSNPEGRSFNSLIQMPFRTAARIMVVNESTKDLSHIFYDINLTRLKSWNPDMLYFHCYWNRENTNVLGKDYTVLPEIKGEGRFLGVSFGLIDNPVYKDCWWGEGEMKFYLDGDKEFPSLCGSGLEDYIGAAWGLKNFYNRYQGCPIADRNRLWTFYRFHVHDPILFKENCRVELQVIGGDDYDKVFALYKANVPLIPISVDMPDQVFHKLLETDKPLKMDDPAFPKGWVNFYRQDDISSTAYFYLNRPAR